MNQQKNVHYFPGHMRKALNNLRPFMNAVDFVIEVVDARIPHSSRNPLLQELAGSKTRLIFLSKADLADPATTAEWVDFFQKQGITAVSGNLKKDKAMSLLEKASKDIVKKKREREARLGMKPQPIRLCIVGVPNVGKSTLINNLAGKAVAKAGNKPGVTRAEQWVKLPSSFILLDSPGILPMHYENEEEAIRLALTGSIREEILPLDALSNLLMDYLRANYPTMLQKRYGIDDISSMENQDIYKDIAKMRGFLLKGGEYDIDKATHTFLKEFQDGLLGSVSLERPNA